MCERANGLLERKIEFRDIVISAFLMSYVLTGYGLTLCGWIAQMKHIGEGRFFAPFAYLCTFFVSLHTYEIHNRLWLSGIEIGPFLIRSSAQRIKAKNPA